jgi:hypothetical protein
MHALIIHQLQHGPLAGPVFREADSADVQQNSQQVAEAEALQAALTQLELTTLIRMNHKVEQMAELMKE